MAPRLPPPVPTASPVTATARGDARNTTTSATSSAVTSRRRLLAAARSGAHLLGRPAGSVRPVGHDGGHAFVLDETRVHDDHTDSVRAQLVSQVGGERGDRDVSDRAGDGVGAPGV